ncbi:MAG: hypothetical protein JSU70_04585 [Phycisphaerales bacterium]|nr:MAG: hypothetical protein JSU70_04585 [Phycisphaerales bacterium]
MKIRFFTVTLVLLAVLAVCAESAPLKIIFVTENSAESEKGYSEFIKQIYSGNADVRIDPDRYDESLSDKKKNELASADLIIISRDADGKDYNGDADFWNELSVPILNHNIKLARSNGHDYWDWLAGDSNETDLCTVFAVADPNDEIFTYIDVSAGTAQMFATGKDIDLSDQSSAGNGATVATCNGNVAIARWLGSETSYYEGSDYAPGGPRVFFALPEMTYEFFEDATEPAKLMLENAILSLLPVPELRGDLDDDRDVDFDDFVLFCQYWMSTGCTEDSACGGANLAGDPNVSADDLEVLGDNWLAGADVAAPEPNVMTWDVEPYVTSTTSIYMAATEAHDAGHGVEYFFQCTSGNGPGSDWQYSTIYEPNGLAPGTEYAYRAKARDISSRFNETEWSDPATARTFAIYHKIADASAAAALDAHLFIVGGDEDSKLCVYDSNSQDPDPIAEPSVGEFLYIDPEEPETDIEGATWFNGRVFWITSHGRNRFGKYRYSRCQFFATTVTIGESDITVTVDGNYTNLIDDLIAYDLIYGLGLADAIGVVDGQIDPNEIPDLAPKEKGLNIEGLSTTADGNSMLIGFRNPRPKVDGDRMALIIRLNNPEQVVLSGHAPDFDPPILLDLDDGYGIRSLEYSPTLGMYLLMAGSHKAGSDEPIQTLYTYDMDSGALSELYDFEPITPEAMFQLPAGHDVHLLSDDGTLIVDTPEGPIQNKFLPRDQRTFRAHVVTP